MYQMKYNTILWSIIGLLFRRHYNCVSYFCQYHDDLKKIIQTNRKQTSKQTNKTTTKKQTNKHTNKKKNLSQCVAGIKKKIP